MGRKAKIRIYGSERCSYCTAARMLLQEKGLEFDEVLVTGNDGARERMEALTGGRTVPQVMIDETPVGGFDELYEMERSGELDRLLGIAANEI